MFCYWNGCIKDGPDGPFYQEGSIPRVMRVESKTDLPTFLNDLHRVTGFDKAKFQIDLIGRYPSIVQQSLVKYMRLPIVDDSSLETMLEVPSYHPSITNIELYIEVKPLVSDGSRKRNRQEDSIVDADVNANLRDSSDRWTEDGESTEDRNCGDGGAAEKIPHKKKLLILSSSWLDESELQIGMLFRDKEELDNAVKLYSVRRQREYHAYESSATFECKNGGCGWILKAAETKKGTGFKITKYRGPHTCKPSDVCSDFLAGELQGLIKAQPSLSTSELIKWVKEEFGYTVSGDNMWEAKKKAITSILGDLDKSFSVLPKFMDALSSSNKMVTDLQYSLSPDHPKEASFRSVFWAFQQSIKGFPHLRPMIMVDTVELSSKHSGKLLVAAGFDAGNRLYPLAFAIVVTQESFSTEESWRWFFECIRKKVTQRESLCLITSPDPEIISALNEEPECRQWAQHRFCLRHLCLKFYQVFHSNLMTELVYKAGSSRYVSSFDYYLKKIEKMNPEAKEWLDQLPRQQWVLAYDDGGIRFGIMETNSIFTTYGFVNKALDLPFTTCVLLIFDHLAEVFKTRRCLISESVKRGDKYVKRVVTKLDEYAVASRAHSVLQVDQTGQRFQVTEGVKVGKKRYFVHLGDGVCACGVWQLCKYPCSHVLAVCRKLNNIDHLQYVNDYYSTQHSLEVYAAGFNPVPGVSDWPEATEFPRLVPPGSRPDVRTVSQ